MVAKERNNTAEALLERLNGALAQVEPEFAPPEGRPERPVVFVVGSGPRCGSTLFSQLLAATGAFAYPTNFIARFWNAPAFGASLFSALGLDSEPVRFDSELGRIEGWGGPHEFGNFLRRWLPLGDGHKSEVETVDADTAGMVNAELAALEKGGGRPVMLRNLIYGLHIPQVRQVLENSVFVYCRRDPLYQVQSVLLARKKVAGSYGQWWSVRPPGWRELLSLPPFEQVAAQVRAVSRVVLDDAGDLPAERFQVVDYERVCREPGAVVREVLERFAGAGLDVRWDEAANPLPGSFTCTNIRRMDEAEFSRVRDAVDAVIGEEGR